MTSERWQDLGLTQDEWRECLEASQELAALHPGGRVASAGEIAAQMAVAKAAEERWPLDPDGPLRLPAAFHADDAHRPPRSSRRRDPR